MAADDSSRVLGGLGPIEHELTIHLERAHELAERARRANDAVKEEIARAREIAEDLRGHMDEFGRR